MSQKIGPREQQLRDLRERKFEDAKRRSRDKVPELRERVASIPAVRARPARKKRR